MQNLPTAVTRTYIVIMVILGWFALIAQLYITASLQLNPVPEMLIRYFSYFTIEVNMLVAILFTVLLLNSNSGLGRFFSSQQTTAAITVYIVIVGLIYNTILRFIWSPEGFQRIVDELLHAVIPALALIYWLMFAAKDQLKWKNVLPWLIYPFAYIIYVLIRGSYSGFYPYPFINTSLLGLNKVLVNSVGIAGVFIFMSLAIIAVAKFAKR